MSSTVAADAFVFPTIDDGFGMALLEAMAHGLPTVTTTHCGAAELFTPDHDLIIVPAQDAEKLAHAIQRLYTSPDLRHRLRAGALHALEQIEGDGAYQLYRRLWIGFLLTPSLRFHPDDHSSDGSRMAAAIRMFTWHCLGQLASICSESFVN